MSADWMVASHLGELIYVHRRDRVLVRHNMAEQAEHFAPLRLSSNFRLFFFHEGSPNYLDATEVYNLNAFEDGMEFGIRQSGLYGACSPMTNTIEFDRPARLEWETYRTVKKPSAVGIDKVCNSCWYSAAADELVDKSRVQAEEDGLWIGSRYYDYAENRRMFDGVDDSTLSLVLVRGLLCDRFLRFRPLGSGPINCLERRENL